MIRRMELEYTYRVIDGKLPVEGKSMILTEHEREDLGRDFGIFVEGYSILACLTYDEWYKVIKGRANLC